MGELPIEKYMKWALEQPEYKKELKRKIEVYIDYGVIEDELYS